jgi:hypothetical protein
VPLSSAADEPRQLYSFQCKLLDLKGDLVNQFPQSQCAFFDDGRVVGASQTELSLYGADGGKLWRHELNAHHTIRINSEKNILVMHSSIHRYLTRLTRFDRVGIFNSDGAELKHFDFYEHRKAILKLAHKNSRSYDGPTFRTLWEPPESRGAISRNKFTPVNHEFSHANSFFEIPANTLEAKDSRFAAGNYIVHVNGLDLILILDRNLKRILWSVDTSRVGDHVGNIHDVQLLPSGKILFFNNMYTEVASAIEELDPISLARKVLFLGTKENHFYGDSQGSVQLLHDGHLLVAQFQRNIGGRLFEADSSGKIIFDWRLKRNGLTGRAMEGLQEVKLLDLSEFVKQNLLL